MAQGYYTLEEASKFLALSVDELRQMAQKNQIRSFQDRGTLRFRVQDIQELARQRGAASDLDLPLGETPAPKTPKSQLGIGSKAVKDDSDEDFSLEVNDDAVDIGREPSGTGKSGKVGGGSSRKISPRPLPGSDSDVKLITDGDLALDAHSDSDIRLVSPVSDPKVASSGSRRRSSLVQPSTPPVISKSGKLSGKLSGKIAADALTPKSKLLGPGSPLPQKKSQLRATPGSDSGVRLVPMDSDSDVKIVGKSDEVPLGGAPIPDAADSDIRLERFTKMKQPVREEMLLTEEINLDEEIQRQEEALKQQPPQAKLKPKSRVPSASPFELSDHDLGPKTPPRGEKVSQPDSSDFDLLPAEPSTDSSDFDLVPAGDGSVVLENNPADFSLELPEDSDFTLTPDDSAGGELKGPTSGINLADPVDAGLSLEEPDEGSDVDFEISLDGGATPTPARADDSSLESSNEFEINLEDSSGEMASGAAAPAEESDFDLGADMSSGEAAPLPADSDSEFELTLDSDESSSELEAADAADATPSDSEFELTLDDSGNLAGEDETPSEEGAEQDIFESDFEVPGLEDESGSQVAALDTDLESSDFEIEVEDESGSQVVALDEEEADDAAMTVAAKSKPKQKGKTKVVVDSDGDEPAASSIDDFQDLADEGAAGEAEPSEEEETVTAPAGGFGTVKVLRPAPWGVFPVVFMLPCAIIMVLVGLLGFELIQNVNGYRPPGLLTKALADMMSLKLK